MRGRPPKPTALKLLAGNPGKRRLPKNEPKPPDGPIEKPKLGKWANEVWDQYAPQIMAMGLLTPVDVPAFAMLCHLIGQSQHKPAAMPANRIARLESLFGKFGMTPAERARLGMGREKPRANSFVALA